MTDLKSILELLQFYQYENNDFSFEENIQSRARLYKELRIFSEMLAEVAKRFSDASRAVEQLANKTMSHLECERSISQKPTPKTSKSID